MTAAQVHLAVPDGDRAAPAAHLTGRTVHGGQTHLLPVHGATEVQRPRVRAHGETEHETGRSSRDHRVPGGPVGPRRQQMHDPGGLAVLVGPARVGDGQVVEGGLVGEPGRDPQTTGGAVGRVPEVDPSVTVVVRQDVGAGRCPHRAQGSRRHAHRLAVRVAGPQQPAGALQGVEHPLETGGVVAAVARGRPQGRRRVGVPQCRRHHRLLRGVRDRRGRQQRGQSGRQYCGGGDETQTCGAMTSQEGPSPGTETDGTGRLSASTVPGPPAFTSVSQVG